MTKEDGQALPTPPRGSPREPPGEVDLRRARSLPPVASDHDEIVATTEIETTLGQSIQSALDFANWDEGSGLKGLGKAQTHLLQTIHDQKRILHDVRRHILNELSSFPNAPAHAGVYRATEDNLRLARRSILLSGRISAARGASVGHDSLVASLVSIGICLTRYDGQMRSWRTVFLRHDCDLRSGNPVDDIRAILDQRARRSRVGPGAAGQDGVSRLMRRAFQSAAERKSLLEKGGPGWRMGYGVPAPYDLLTGSGSMELVDAILPVLEDLLLTERKWVFIPDSLSSLAFTTIAAALPPQHLAIIQKAGPTLESIVDKGHYESEYRAKVRRFVDRAGEDLVIGGFRATPHSPAQLFFAHAENAIHAGLIAMADAELQPHRGFPLLLELAGLSAKVGLGIDAFQGMVESTYARAGATSFYMPDGVVLPQFGD